MDILGHFERKKQRFQAFFIQFHSLIDQIQFACFPQIDSECQIAIQLLKDTAPSIIHNECAQMQKREPEALTRIVDTICNLLKSHLIHKGPNVTQKSSESLMGSSEAPKDKSEARPISLGKPIRKKSVQNFVTPIKPDLRQNKTIQSDLASPVIGMPLLHQQTQAYSSLQVSIEAKQKGLIQTPVQLYRSNQRYLEPSRNQNLLTCEKLDKKIQEEALQMLSKVKLQRSPSRMRQGSSQKGKTLAGLNNLQPDYNLLAKNLARKFE